MVIIILLQSPFGTHVLFVQVTSQVFNRTHICRTKLFQLDCVFCGPLIFYSKPEKTCLFKYFHSLANFVDYCSVVSCYFSVCLILRGCFFFCINFHCYIFFPSVFMLF